MLSILDEMYFQDKGVAKQEPVAALFASTARGRVVPWPSCLPVDHDVRVQAVQQVQTFPEDFAVATQTTGTLREDDDMTYM